MDVCHNSVFEPRTPLLSPQRAGFGRVKVGREFAPHSLRATRHRACLNISGTSRELINFPSMVRSHENGRKRQAVLFKTVPVPAGSGIKSDLTITNCI